MEIHHEDLEANWKLLSNGEEYFKIDPLKWGDEMLAPRITSVEAPEDYKIKINYETGEIKLFNVLPYISGAWYKELNDYNYFKTVHIISNGNGIEWEHGQDIAPHELYDMGISVE